MFEQFDNYLRDPGDRAKGGQIVDATIIPVPKQHHSKEEKQQLAIEGRFPLVGKRSPIAYPGKDLDARWTKKNGQSYFGYKNHISIDVDYGFIRRYPVTDAAVHDSQVLGALLDDKNEGGRNWGGECLS